MVVVNSSLILDDIRARSTSPIPNMNSYDDFYREFKLEKPEYFNFGFEVIDVWANDNTKLALITANPSGDKFEKYSFSELKRLSNRFANILLSLGAAKGDRLFIMLPRIHVWHVAMLGAIKLGVIPMPATTMCTNRDIEYRIGRAEAKFAITDSENLPKFFSAKNLGLRALICVGGEDGNVLDYGKEMEAASEDLNRNDAEPTRISDPAMIWFTSGTEGPPKMVLHDQEYFLSHYLTAKFWMDLKPTDLHWTLSDTGWAKSTYGYFSGQWLLGAAVFLHDARGKFDSMQTLDLVHKIGVTTFCAPPTAWRMIVREDFKKDFVSSLRHCFSAGEPLNPEVIRLWKEKTGLTIYDGYGQSESVIMVANYRCLPVKPGSMGKPVPGWHIDVVDENGHRLPPMTEGFIAARVLPERPPGLFKEYWKDPEATKSRFVNGWYFTGDKGYKDADGYFWFVGRADDIIKSAGYRIGPFEVESALIEHEAVLEAAVVPSPDPIRGSIVKAYVILRPAFSPSEELVKELQDHVKRTTAPYKYPREIEFVKEFPKTISGKIRRVELRRIEMKNGTGIA